MQTYPSCLMWPLLTCRWYVPAASCAVGSKTFATMALWSEAHFGYPKDLQRFLFYAQLVPNVLWTIKYFGAKFCRALERDLVSTNLPQRKKKIAWTISCATIYESSVAYWFKMLKEMLAARAAPSQTDAKKLLLVVVSIFHRSISKIAMQKPYNTAAHSGQSFWFWSNFEQSIVVNISCILLYPTRVWLSVFNKPVLEDGMPEDLSGLISTNMRSSSQCWNLVATSKLHENCCRTWSQYVKL